MKSAAWYGILADPPRLAQWTLRVLAGGFPALQSGLRELVSYLAADLSAKMKGMQQCGRG
jgi:hypothetical protein